MWRVACAEPLPEAEPSVWTGRISQTWRPSWRLRGTAGPWEDSELGSCSLSVRLVHKGCWVAFVLWGKGRCDSERGEAAAACGGPQAPLPPAHGGLCCSPAVSSVLWALKSTSVSGKNSYGTLIRVVFHLSVRLRDIGCLYNVGYSQAVCARVFK